MNFSTGECAQWHVTGTIVAQGFCMIVTDAALYCLKSHIFLHKHCTLLLLSRSCLSKAL